MHVITGAFNCAKYRELCHTPLHREAGSEAPPSKDNLLNNFVDLITLTQFAGIGYSVIKTIMVTQPESEGDPTLIRK